MQIKSKSFLFCLTGLMLQAALLPLLLYTSATNAAGFAVPIGGALKADNDEVWARIVALAGGKGSKFAVFATAADNPEKSAQAIIASLTKHGAVAEHILVAPMLKESASQVGYKTAARSPTLVRKVKESQGVFFSGGSQERITQALLNADGSRTPVLEAIWSVFEKGGVVAGTSAGAAIMSKTMFRDAPDVLDVLKFGARMGSAGNERELDIGLGFAGADLFVDQHFLKRGRLGRLIPAMQTANNKIGLGVEENSAAIIQGSTIEVIGAKGAIFADLREADTDKTTPEFNLKNIKLTYLDSGDKFDYSTGILMPSAAKLNGTKINHTAANFKPYFSDETFYPAILGDNTIYTVMSNLIDNKRPRIVGLAFNPTATAEKRPELGFEFKFSKGANSLGYFTSSSGGERYTVANIYLDIIPVVINLPLYVPVVETKVITKAIAPAKN
jgi:cyanophycinase